MVTFFTNLAIGPNGSDTAAAAGGFLLLTALVFFLLEAVLVLVELFDDVPDDVAPDRREAAGDR